MSSFGRSSVFKSSTTIAVFIVLLAANFIPQYVSVPFIGLLALLTIPAAMLYQVGPSMAVDALASSVPISQDILSQVGLILTFYLFAVVIGFIHRQHSSGF